jgi:hypothetical protein
MIHLVLPVYYTQEFKTKPSKTFLVSMNWYRNAHHFIKNTLKKDYHELIGNQLKGVSPIPNDSKYQVHYTYYYKSVTSDLPNVTPMTSKWLNDSLQSLGIVKNDDVRHLVREVHEVGYQDKENPRVEIKIKIIKENK